MTFLHSMVDFILHIDKHLLAITTQYGGWSYGLIFLIIFMETGFIVTPFLPGDSLLFAAGSLSALGSFNIIALWLMCVAAAFLGDTVNYWIGRLLGERLFKLDTFLFKKKNLDKAQAFYDKHGVSAIILARFVPIVRTFAPCVAGISKMHYTTFMIYNLIGGVLWVSLFTLGGFFLGNIPAVKQNFHIVVIAIVLISVVPIIFELVKAKLENREQRAKSREQG